ncbi:MAG: PaaI family thioesterase [Acidimicrobiales bacterium]|nr:PaaI family thioesterase [Acidimicrobiales bacterium]
MTASPGHDATDWSDRFDRELAESLLAGSEVPEGADTGIPGYLDIRFTEVEPGWCVAEIDVGEHLLNPFGAAHGAVLASLVDHVLGSAVFPLVPRGTWPATLEFKLNYLAPTRPGILRATSQVLSLSKRTAVVSVSCENDGRLVGTALGTIALTPPRPAG